MTSTGVGDELRRERIRQGLSLDQIVQRTKISPRSLHAIEEDALDQLPGVVFARNFVRLYAADLKLDADALVARLPRLDIDAAPLPNPPARDRRPKRDPRLTATIASFLWLITAAGAVTGGWYYFNRERVNRATTVAAAPAPVSKPVSPGSPPPPPQVPLDGAAVPTDSPQSVAADSNTSVITDSANSRAVQVVLTAKEAAWVRISADGRTAFVGLLHPHDTRSVVADALIKIFTGNAGGLDISLNGKVLDPLGPSGQVRTVSLTAEGPQFVPRTPLALSPL
jgi:cytoskeletal protein RodZ